MNQEHVRDYITLSDCYDIFNERLFGGELRGCVLTFEDRGPRNFGHFRLEGFLGLADEGKRDEICLNPRHFLTNTGDLELLQTLAHEQCHQWQYQHGKPSKGYHNREWADKMLSIGLTPSDTGKPGGRMVGQSMADYPTEGGKFLQVATEILASKKLIRWYRSEVVIRKVQELASVSANTAGDVAVELVTALAAQGVEPKPPRPPSKLTYQCPECKSKVWGKPGLSLICGRCHLNANALIYLTQEQ